MSKSCGHLPSFRQLSRNNRGSQATLVQVAPTETPATIGLSNSTMGAKPGYLGFNLSGRQAKRYRGSGIDLLHRCPLFPTCQVRAVRFYVSCLAAPPTWTAVFSAGPQPPAGDGSVPRRTSTASQKICQIERQRECQNECPKICQKECQKECRNNVSIHARNFVRLN